MVRSLYDTGIHDKKLTQVKSNSGAMIWWCADGRMTEIGEHSYLFRLTACDTLAVANLLFDNYPEIVRAARAEQRAYEDERVPGGKAEIAYH